MISIPDKQARIDHNETMVEWLQSEVDKMKQQEQNIKILKKIASYTWDIFRRKSRIEKHKQDILNYKEGLNGKSRNI